MPVSGTLFDSRRKKKKFPPLLWLQNVPAKQRAVQLIMKNKEGERGEVYFNKDRESMQFNQCELIKKKTILWNNQGA